MPLPRNLSVLLDSEEKCRLGESAGESGSQVALVSANVRLMARLCFALDLYGEPASIAEYERMHGPGEVWPKVIEHIRATGVQDMEIWRTGDRLLMIAEVSEDYPRPIEAPNEVEQWEKLMWRFQRALPHAAAGEKWVAMKRIFALDEQ